jgi:hypothetical protein
MKARCTNPKVEGYERYQGKLCERWHRFENFLADMGERPSLQHSLDRWPDRWGNYEPGNVRWATPSEQARNRTTIRPVIRSDGRWFASPIEAAEATGVRRQDISMVCCGRQKTTKGFGWRYADG